MSNLIPPSDEARFPVSVSHDVPAQTFLDLLPDAQDQLAIIFENAPIGIALLDLDGHPVRRNPAMRRFVAQRLGVDLDAHYATFTHPEDLKNELPLMKSLAAGKNDYYQIEKRYLRQGKQSVWGRVTATLVRDRGGEPQFIVTMVEEIDEHKRNEERLWESEARFRRLAQHAPDMIFRNDFNEGRGYSYVSPAVTDILGYSPEEFYADPDIRFKLVHPDDQVKLHEMRRTHHERNSETLRWRHKDGHYVWISTRTAPVCDANGKLIAIEGIARDISEQMRVEQELRESEERFRAIFEKGPVGVTTAQPDGRLISCNPAFARMLGYETSELSGKHFSYYTPPQDTEVHAKQVEEVLDGKRDVIRIEKRVLRKDGKEIWVRTTGSLVRTEDARSGFIISTVEDITEQREMQTALGESERRYRMLFDSTNDALMIHDVEGKVLEANMTACETLGYTREEILELNVSQIDAPDFAAGAVDRRNELIRTGQAVFEVVHRTRSGTAFPVEVSARVIEYDGKKAIFSISRDISERKRLQEQLSRAQRLETAGRIAGQVAHDFNNLLGPMAAYPDLIKTELPGGHPAAAYCDEMSRAAQIMAEINSDMLVLSRRGLLKQEPVDVRQVVKQAMQAVADLPEGVRLDLQLASGTVLVSGSQAQLLRVISNLISNAREAMHDRGTITISTEVVTVQGSSTGHDRVPPGQFVRLVVRDTGGGIPEEIRERVFDPFFSTKKADRRRGSGLGLAIVHSVVEDHGGYVEVESEVGLGTAFVIYLPLHQGQANAHARGSLPRGTESILVVDDDAIQRTLAKTVLGQMGYRVATASSGEEALSHLKANRVDLVLLDMIMEGGIDGAETYRQMVQMVPGQRAIIMSGYAESDRVQDARRLGVGEFLMKPLTVGTLLKAVRDELDSGR